LRDLSDGENLQKGISEFGPSPAPASVSYPKDGTATANLMTGIAEVESTYTQFRTHLENNPDLYNLYATYGIAAKWPYESAGGGKYIGLMQILAAANQQSDPNAWKWADSNLAATANANDAVNLFSGTPTPNKMTIVGPSSSGYEGEIINGVSSQNIPGHVGLRSLTGLELENMALVLYGGWLTNLPCGPGLQCVLNSQYYIPQCSGTQKKNKQGNLTCSTGWQWAINSTNQSAGISYVSNSSNTGVRNKLQ
jgi:hypothetical protein